MAVFHVELRRFPHSARAFNLAEQELLSRVLDPWVRGEEFEFGERRWNPSRCDLQILEGDRLRPDELSIGRGWQNALRSATDVTERLLAAAPGVRDAAAATPAAADVFPAAILDAAADGPISFPDVVRMANERFVGLSASERLAVCEQAVWRLLRDRRMRMLTEAAPVDPAHWATVVADWETWTRDPPQVWLVGGEGLS